MTIVVVIIYYFTQLLAYAIFARTLLSWFPLDKESIIFQALDSLTDPILVPLRKVVPMIGMIDITPMIAIFLLFGIGQALAGTI